jgi:hypothetical protein
VSVPAGDRESESVREGYTFVLAKFSDGSRDHILVPKGQMLVVEQHFDGFGDIVAGAVVNRIEDPGCLSQYQMRYPCAFGDEVLSALDPFLVVPRDESNQELPAALQRQMVAPLARLAGDVAEIGERGGVSLALVWRGKPGTRESRSRFK